MLDLRTENGLHVTISTIQRGIFHVSLCELKTVYMVPTVHSTAGIIHVRLCQLKRVYM